ncbi:MAG: Crp/Fnr family transcriptional regulator [Firmicutes bacterium]|nr:Crp/Fnr family transcriptional regulator [Bacillota bacterium]
MNTEQIAACLKQAPLFSGLDDPDLSRLASVTRPTSYPAGETIFSEGDEAKGFYVVASGKVKVFKMSGDGKEHILRVFGRAEPVGEVAVFTGGRFPANAETLVESTALFVPRKEFLRLIQDRPEIALNMVATLSERLRWFADVIEDLSLREVSARLARYFLSLAGPARPAEFVLDMPKSDLASSLGTVAETLSRTLARMRQDGIIAVNRDRVRVLDRGNLERLAAGFKVEVSKLLDKDYPQRDK